MNATERMASRVCGVVAIAFSLAHCSSGSGEPSPSLDAGTGADARSPSADDASTDSGRGSWADAGDASDAAATDSSGGDTGTDGASDAEMPDSGPTGPVTPQPGGPPGPGVLPPKVASVTYLGHLAYDDPRIARDLGFSGVLNHQIVWTFGDTLLQPPD